MRQVKAGTVRARGPKVALGGLLVAAILVAMGCGGSQTAGTASQGGPAQIEDSLAIVRETLHKGADFNACRGAVQQLNDHVNRSVDDKPAPLTDRERDLLTGPFGLTPDELSEAASTSFTLLDAHHLDTSLLFRDAAASLNVDRATPLEKAAAAFDWTVRQIRLQQRPGGLLPPFLVLRLGTGTAQERGVVFLNLLHQLGIDGCMLAVPGADPKQPASSYWIPAVVLDKDLYLFETRLGLPVPAPKGQAPATLAQVRSDPGLLKALCPDDKHPYDVTADQVRGVELHIAASLSALSPRMRWLQEKLSGPDGVVLAQEPVRLFERLEALTREKALEGCAVKVWNQPGDSETPARALRSYLPADEGGTDKSNRRAQVLAEIVPWNVLPRSVLDVPGQPGRVLREAFAGQPLSFLLEPKMPRDLVLRGRYDEATTRLVKVRDELRLQMTLVSAASDFDKRMTEWREAATEVYANLLRAESEAAKSPAAQAHLVEARNSVNLLWKGSSALLVLVRSMAAEPLSAQATYQLALCKHEQAERAQAVLDQARRQGKSASASETGKAREAWHAAAEWWETFMEEFPASPAAADARLFRARAVEQLGQKEAAIALLQNAPPEADVWEGSARLLRLKQLQAR